MDCPCTSDGQHVPTFIGTLGTLDHFRCRQCGWDWSEPTEDEPEDSEDEPDGQPDEMQEWHDFDPDC